MAPGITIVTRVLLVALIAILVYRRKHRYSYAFASYVAVQALVNVMGSLWRAFSRTWSDWADKETLYGLLRILILFELTALIFRALPRARRRAQALLLLTVLLLAVVLQRSHDTTSLYAIARGIAASFSYVTVWGLIALLVMIVWYRLPLHPFHKAILHGLLWLLLVYFGAVYSARAIGGPAAGDIFNTAQIGILALWLCAAWKRDPEWDSGELAVIRYLQPWRAA